jgi:hypothetical protein
VRRTGETDDGSVGVVEGFEGEYLVAGPGEREDRRGYRFRGARADDDVGPWIELQAVEPLLVRGDRLAQDGQSLTGRVLVRPACDGSAGGVEDLPWSVLVRESLPEIDGGVLLGEGRDLLEDREAEPAVVAEEIRTVRRPGPRRCSTDGGGVPARVSS